MQNDGGAGTGNQTETAKFMKQLYGKIFAKCSADKTSIVNPNGFAAEMGKAGKSSEAIRLAMNELVRSNQAERYQPVSLSDLHSDRSTVRTVFDGGVRLVKNLFCSDVDMFVLKERVECLGEALVEKVRSCGNWGSASVRSIIPYSNLVDLSKSIIKDEENLMVILFNLRIKGLCRVWKEAEKNVYALIVDNGHPLTPPSEFELALTKMRENADELENQIVYIKSTIDSLEKAASEVHRNGYHNQAQRLLRRKEEKEYLLATVTASWEKALILIASSERAHASQQAGEIIQHGSDGLRNFQFSGNNVQQARSIMQTADAVLEESNQFEETICEGFESLRNALSDEDMEGQMRRMERDNKKRQLSSDEGDEDECEAGAGHKQQRKKNGKKTKY